jgi:hypothetical protein
MMEERVSLFYMSCHANLKYSLLFAPPIVPMFPIVASNLQREALPRLISSLGRHHRPESLEDDVEVKPQAPVADVSKIQPYHLVKCGTAPSTDLPHTCDPRFHLQDPPAMPAFIDITFVSYRWSWPHQTHIPFEDIEELRE